MAHLIEGDARFFEIGDSAGHGLAWHKLGTVVPRDMAGKIGVEDAFRLGGLIFDVNTYPLCYRLPDGTVVDTDKFVIVREEHVWGNETHPAVLLSEKVVSGDYQTIDNTLIAKSLEGLAKEWPIETCGVLRNGKAIFATFDVGGFAIKGDEHHMWMVAHEPKDGSGALNINITPVRAVCNNTVMMGIEAAEWSANIRHNGDVVRDLDFWSRVLPELAAKAKDVQEILDALANQKATAPQVKKIIAAAFPEPTLPAKVKAANLAVMVLTEDDVANVAKDSRRFETRSAYEKGMRELAAERYDVFNQENPETAGTLFAITQAVNEVAMWRPSRGDIKTVYEAQLLGKRATASKAAFRTAVALLK